MLNTKFTIALVVVLWPKLHKQDLSGLKPWGLSHEPRLLHHYLLNHRCITPKVNIFHGLFVSIPIIIPYILALILENNWSIFIWTIILSSILLQILIITVYRLAIIISNGNCEFDWISEETALGLKAQFEVIGKGT